MNDDKILKCPHCYGMTMTWDEQQNDWCCQSCGYIGLTEEDPMHYLLLSKITRPVEKSPVEGVDRNTFMRVLNYIDDFIHHLPGGDSYWVDPKGIEHYTDVSYGIEFMEQVKEYFENN